jgi:hypothetical protein
MKNIGVQGREAAFLQGTAGRRYRRGRVHARGADGFAKTAIQIAAGTAALLAGMGYCLLSQPLWANEAQAASARSDKWQPWIETEGKLGSKRSLGEIDLFVPIDQDHDTLFFGDFRLRMDDASSREGNFGFGLRQMLSDGWNIGGYGYYDRRRSPTGHTYNQLTIGAELLGRDFDLRANSYWPVGNRENQVGATDQTEAVLNGTQVQMITHRSQMVERAIGGFDAEVGWRVPIFDAESNFDLRVYAGGYRFDGDGVEAIYGPRFRAEFVSFDTPGLWEGARVTLGGEWQHDDVRGSQSFASLRLRIPLQAAPKGSSRPASLQERRMTTAIVRDIDIVTGQQVTQLPDIVETASLVGGNGPVEKVVQLDASAIADLPTEVAAAGPNSLIVLNGTANVTTANVVMQNGQTLAGGGSQIALQGIDSGRTATLTLPGTAGQIDMSTGWSIRAADNSTITGLTLSRTGSSAGWGVIAVDGVSNVAILNNTITSKVTGGDHATAIRLVGQAENILISGNKMDVSTPGGPGTFASGIAAQSGGGTWVSATITNNHVTVDGGADENSFIKTVQDIRLDTARSTGNTGNVGCSFNAQVTGTIELNGASC